MLKEAGGLEGEDEDAGGLEGEDGEEDGDTEPVDGSEAEAEAEAERGFFLPLPLLPTNFLFRLIGNGFRGGGSSRRGDDGSTIG